MICVILPMDDDAAVQVAQWWHNAGDKPSAHVVFSPSRETVTRNMQDAAAVFYFGHGDPDAWITCDGAVRFADAATIAVAKEKLVVAMACFSGDQLGDAAIAAGVRTYVGFTKRLFAIKSSPEFASAGTSALSVLLHGAPAEKFAAALRHEFERLVEYFKSGPGSGRPNSTASWLAAFRSANCIVLKGDAQATL